MPENTKCNIYHGKVYVWIHVKRDNRFISKVSHNLRARPPSYVTDVINLAVRTKCPMGRRIEALLKINTCQQLKFRTELKTRLQTSDSTRRMLYRQINPAINTYEALKLLTIPEHHRVALSRIRTGSHHLRSETGRWARIPQKTEFANAEPAFKMRNMSSSDVPSQRISDNHTIYIMIICQNYLNITPNSWRSIATWYWNCTGHDIWFLTLLSLITILYYHVNKISIYL